MYIRCTKCLISRKLEYLEFYKFNGKLCTLDVGIVWICRKFEYLELGIFNGKLCTLDLRIV